MNNLKTIRTILILSVLPVILFLSSCKNNATSPSVTQTAAMRMIASTNTGGGNIALVDTKFLIEFVKFQRTLHSDDANAKDGPFVLFLKLNTVPGPVYLFSIPAGTYKEMHIKIHKHTPGEPVIDPDFGDTGSVGFSGVIHGTYNGNPFTYKTAITTNYELDFSPWLVVLSNTVAFSVTLWVDPSNWFMSNGNVLDPNDPNNANTIDNNIKDSFKKAFRDDDGDGIPDHQYGKKDVNRSPLLTVRAVN